MSWGPSRIREVCQSSRPTQNVVHDVTQEFLFYYQRDPAQERLPSSGG